MDVDGLNPRPAIGTSARTAAATRRVRSDDARLGPPHRVCRSETIAPFGHGAIPRGQLDAGRRVLVRSAQARAPSWAGHPSRTSQDQRLVARGRCSEPRSDHRMPDRRSNACGVLVPRGASPAPPPQRRPPPRRHRSATSRPDSDARQATLEARARSRPQTRSTLDDLALRPLRIGRTHSNRTSACTSVQANTISTRLTTVALCGSPRIRWPYPGAST